MRRQDFIESKMEDIKFRVSFPGEVVTTQKNIDDFAISFHQWMRVNDTQENAEKYFHYTDKDMLNEFKKGL